MTTGAERIDAEFAGGGFSFVSAPSRWTGLFALAGLAMLVAQPGLAFAGAAAVLISLGVTGLCVLGARNPDGIISTRAAARVLSSVLLALMLWVAIIAGAVVAGEAGAFWSAVTATAVFVLVVMLEGLVAASIAVFWSTLSGSDPSIGVSLQVADKYAGFLGEVV